MFYDRLQVRAQEGLWPVHQEQERIERWEKEEGEGPGPTHNKQLCVVSHQAGTEITELLGLETLNF